MMINSSTSGERWRVPTWEMCFLNNWTFLLCKFILRWGYVVVLPQTFIYCFLEVSLLKEFVDKSIGWLTDHHHQNTKSLLVQAYKMWRFASFLSLQIEYLCVLDCWSRKKDIWRYHVGIKELGKGIFWHFRL